MERAIGETAAKSSYWITVPSESLLNNLCLSLSLVNYWDFGLFLHGARDCVCLEGGFREVSTPSSHSYMISVSVIFLLRLFGVTGPISD